MDGIRLDQFKALASDRQRIVKCIRELQPEVSNRQIARTLGVDETTIRRDAAANAAEGPKEPKENKARESSPVRQMPHRPSPGPRRRSG